MDVLDARRLRELEGENTRLKRILGEVKLLIDALYIAFGVKRYPRMSSAQVFRS